MPASRLHPQQQALHVAKVISEVEEMREDWGVSYEGKPQVDIDKVRAKKDKVIAALTGGLGNLAKRRNVTVIQARGSFIDSNTLKLEGDHESIPEGGQLTFDHCILATGSVSMPPAFASTATACLTVQALALQDIPESLLVVGGDISVLRWDPYTPGLDQK